MVTGINNHSLNNSVSVFPNPASGIINVKSSVSEDNMQLVINNYLGQPVYSEKFSGAFKTQVDLSNFANGIYAVQLITSKGTINKTVTLQNK